MCGVPPGAEVVPYSPEVTKPVIRGGNVTSAIYNEENKENHYERLRKMKFTEKLKYSSDHKTPGATYQWFKEPLRCCKHKHVSISGVKILQNNINVLRPSMQIDAWQESLARVSRRVMNSFVAL